MLFALFYCFSLSVFNLQCFLMGACRTGSCLWSVTRGSVPWVVSARMAGGLCTVVWGLLSARVGVVPVAALPAALDRDLSQCGRPPKLVSSSPQVSLPSHVSLVTAHVCVCGSVCLCVYVWVCIWVCMYLCMSLCISGGVGVLGSFNFLLLILLTVFLISVVVFNLCEALCATFFMISAIQIDR